MLGDLVVMWVVTLLLVLFSRHADSFTCPSTGIVHVPDDTDPCVYYSCTYGICQGAYRCTAGKYNMNGQACAGYGGTCPGPAGYFADCSTTTTTTTTTTTPAPVPTAPAQTPQPVTPTPEPVVSSATGMKIAGGTLQPVYTTALECNQQCAASESCLAYDFNTVTSQCYFHDETTACNLLIADAQVNHAVFIDCNRDPGTGIVGLPSITGTVTSMLMSDNTNAVAVTWAKSACACMLACGSCTAFDFDSSSSTCRVYSETACSAETASATGTIWEVGCNPP